MDADTSHGMMVDAVETDNGRATMESRRSEAKKTLPWIEKYRPATLSDLISHEDIVKTRTFRLSPLNPFCLHY